MPRPGWLSRPFVPCLAGTVLALCIAPCALAAAAPTPAPVSAPRSIGDDIRVSLFAAHQMDRLNPGSASTENSVASGNLAGGAELDYKLADLPVGKPGARPSLHVTGRVFASRRVLADNIPSLLTDSLGVAGDSITVVPDARTVEMRGGVRIAYPIVMADGAPLNSAYFRGEFGSLFAEGVARDVLNLSTYALGVERDAGPFKGSHVELGYGRDDRFSPAFGGNRWKIGVFVQGALTARKEAVGSGLHAFADIEVDTDNKGGPDGMRALLGLSLDADGLFAGFRGLVGGLLGS